MKKLESLKGKIIPALIKLVPVCAAFMLIANSNSTASAINGQSELPKGVKKYRKF